MSDSDNTDWLDLDDLAKVELLVRSFFIQETFDSVLKLKANASRHSSNVEKNLKLFVNLSNRNDLSLKMVRNIDLNGGCILYAICLTVLVPIALMLILWLINVLLKQKWITRCLPQLIKMMVNRVKMTNNTLFREFDMNEDFDQFIAIILNYKVILGTIGFLLYCLHHSPLLLEWALPEIEDKISNENNQTIGSFNYINDHRRMMKEMLGKAIEIYETVLRDLKLTPDDTRSIELILNFEQLEKAISHYKDNFDLFTRTSREYQHRLLAWNLSCLYFVVSLVTLTFKLVGHPDLRTRGVIHDIIGVGYIIIYGLLVITAYQMFMVPIYEENIHPDSVILAFNFWQQLKIW